MRNLSAKRLLCLLALTVGFAGGSRYVCAGDVAERRIIGFSPDAKYFAFEEFGTADGSGFPYTTVFFIDSEADQWLPGTAISVVVEDEESGVDRAKSRAQELAAAQMRATGVVEGNFVVLASQPLGEYPEDPRQLSFGIPGLDPLGGPVARYELRLAAVDVPTDAECYAATESPKRGYALTLHDKDTDQVVALYKDQRVPASRGCPIDYTISDVVVPSAGEASALAVLVSVFREGFEGPDRRFLAVTAHLPR